MPRTRKTAKEENGEPKPPEIDFYLEDGHPNPKAMNVWDFMQALSEEQWGDYIGYLYRVGPKKIPTDRYKYIAVVTAPITKEEIKHLYGGKKFTLHFNRRLGKRQVATYNPEQFDIEAEPIWQDGEQPIDPPSGGRANSAAVGADTANMGILTDLIRDLVAQNAQAQREGKPFDTTAAITEALRIQSAGATAAIDMIAKNKGGAPKENTEFQDAILKRLLDRALDPPQQSSPIEQIKAVLELTKELRPEGGDGGVQNNPWAALATAVGPKLDIVLERVAGILQNWAVLSMNKNPAALAQLQKAGAPATASPAPAVEASPAAANSAPTPEQIEQFESAVIIKRVKKTIVQMLLAGESGEAAAEIAEKMAPEWTDEFVKTLQDDLASLASDPIFKPVLASPRLEEFTQEFLGYFAEEPPAEPAAEASPAA